MTILPRAALILAWLSAPVAAGEIHGVFNLPMLAHGQVMSTLGSAGRPSAGGGARSFATPAPAGAARGLPYPAPTEGFRRQQVANLLDRTARSDPRSADALRAQLARYDYASIYDGIVRPYGLAGNDAASSLAAYMLLGWMIVHEGQEPSPAGVRGVRTQAAEVLSAPRFAAPDIRAGSGEEFKILFVTIHAGWQAARREGTLDRYADGIARMFASGGGPDLRSATIGARGFGGG